MSRCQTVLRGVRIGLRMAAEWYEKMRTIWKQGLTPVS
jgi:hypothetical protein